MAADQVSCALEVAAEGDERLLDGAVPPVLGEADLVVNASSVGMGRPGPTDLPIDPDVLHAGQVVADLIYQPLVTPLLAAARQRGAVAVNGVAMLVHQAALAFELWTDVAAPLPAMTRVVADAVGAASAASASAAADPTGAGAARVATERGHADG